MCDRALFAAHYRRVLDLLGQQHDVLPGGTIHTVRDDVHFLILNTAPDGPEYLLVECPAPVATDTDQVLEAIGRTRAPRTTTLYTAQGRVIARAESVLAGPGNLPRTDLLAAVLPTTFDLLVDAVRAYLTEHTLAGIQRATASATDTQPGLWID